MAVPTRVIRRRLKSIRSTGKIMKAMELVAASKMRRTTQLVLGTRPYATRLQELTDEIRRQIDPRKFEWLVGKGKANGRPQKTLVVAIASDRGLCGGFNAQLVKKTVEFLRVRKDTVRLAIVGRRANQAATRAGVEIVASFESISNGPSFERAQPVSRFIAQEFLEGRFDRIFLAFTDFKSALTQVPTVVQLLPIIPENDLPTLSDEEEAEEPEEETGEADRFEPSKEHVLEKLLPRVVEIRIYQALLESAASEHSARMMAMRSAGDAAGEIFDTLTLTLNQARQAAITQEISEISAGKTALE